MTRGVDTTFLVQLEIGELAGHERAREYLSRQVLDAGHTLALAPQVLAEFIQIVTHPQRFRRPLSMETALGKADHWWRAAEVRRVFPGSAAFTLCILWMCRCGLGRRRILNTLLGATYAASGVSQIVSTNARGRRAFQELEVVDRPRWRPAEANRSPSRSPAPDAAGGSL